VKKGGGKKGMIFAGHFEKEKACCRKFTKLFIREGEKEKSQKRNYHKPWGGGGKGTVRTQESSLLGPGQDRSKGKGEKKILLLIYLFGLRQRTNWRVRKGPLHFTLIFWLALRKRGGEKRKERFMYRLKGKKIRWCLFF